MPCPYQFIPSVENANELEPVPPAIHNCPFHDIVLQLLNIEFPLIEDAHLIPSKDVAIVFVPEPTATHIYPFQAKLLQLVVKGEIDALKENAFPKFVFEAFCIAPFLNPTNPKLPL